MTSQQLDPKVPFAEKLKDILREQQAQGASLIQRRNDGSYVERRPDGSEIVKTYRDRGDNETANG